MNKLLRYGAVFFLLLIPFIGCWGQDFEVMMQRGADFEKKGNYGQAKYYYQLAFKQTQSDSSNAEDKKNRSLKKIAKQDSLLAYNSINSLVKKHMLRFDSLSICCGPVSQIVELERVINLDHSLVYPKIKLKQLRSENPDITKQVRIFQSKIRREAYLAQLNEQKEKIISGKILEGYYGLKAMQTDQHINTELDAEIIRLEKEIENKIRLYEQYIISGDSLLSLNKAELAKVQFDKAKALNSECPIYSNRAERIEAMLVGESWNDEMYEAELQQARMNASAGEVLAAKKGYQYILRWRPMDSIALNELILVEENIKSEQVNKQLQFRVHLQRERADSHFDVGEYAAALVLYKELEGKYRNYFSDIGEIEERIENCEKYLKE